VDADIGPSAEKRFYDALGVVPEVPAGILGRVERVTRRPGILRRASVAACLALALIVPAVVVTNIGSPQAAYADADDFADELFYAFEYLSGDLDDDYLFIDNQVFRLSDGELPVED
jgi:hypothetical protein